MFKYIISIAMFLSSCVYASDYHVSDELINALVKVESNGNPNAVGKLGELGILQIRQCVIDDVNKFVEKRNYYKLSDALDNTKSKEICRKYISYWAKRTKCRPCNEHYAKIWNGGPYGWKKTGFKKVAINLRKYWFKVRKELA